MNRLSASFLLILLFGFSSCKESPSTQSSTPEAESEITTTRVEQVEPYKTEIENRLNAYYSALEFEKIEEEKFFAPTLTSFFGKPLSREKVGESLRNGFSTVENRTLRIDPASLEVEKTSSGYVATFSGTVSFKRSADGSEVHDMFHNQVTFNSDQLITAYDPLPDPAEPQTESMRSARISGPEGFATEVLTLLQEGKLTELQALCPSNFSPLLMVRSGAYSFPSQFSNSEELAEKAHWLAEGMSGLATRITKGDLPTFDCDELFSQQGTFLGKLQGSYDDVSSLMEEIQRADLDTYETDRFSSVKEVEQHVTHRVIDTESGLSFCIGEINGEWKLLVLDFASYDCSA